MSKTANSLASPPVAGQLKKIGKYSILLSIKESYLFSRNLLGLTTHPFKTIREITQERDYSQAALIFGLPFYLVVFSFIFIFTGRWLIHAPQEWGWLAKALLGLTVFLSVMIFIYLAYWFWKIVKRRG